MRQGESRELGHYFMTNDVKEKRWREARYHT
jgi:hypothetical protein